MSGEGVVSARVAPDHSLQILLVLKTAARQELIDPEAVAAVERFSARAGLAIVSISEARHDVTLRGPAGALQSAFGVELERVEHPHGDHHTHDGEPVLPPELEGHVLGVLGLDESPRHRRSEPEAPTGGGRALPAPVLADHYGFPTDATGAGQRVAVLSFAGGYHPDDLDHYFTRVLGRPVPSITDRAVAGASNAPLDAPTLAKVVADYDDPSMTFGELVKKWGPKVGFAAQATLEVTMDLQIVGSLAPGAAIDAVFGPNSATGFYRAIHAALGDEERGVPCADLITISWGMSEARWGSHLAVVDRALEKARQKGVTVFCASGDFGSANVPSSSIEEANVNFPASSPNVLAVGGTQFELRGPNDPNPETPDGERAWNGVALGAPMATGGGVSGHFARPDYQADAGVPAHDALDGPSWLEEGQDGGFVARGVPDVAANAAEEGGFQIYVGGRLTTGAGTSAATPLWAALIARLNEATGRRAGFLNEVLYGSGGWGLRPVTEGDNALVRGIASYRAGPGWNGCCGLGSPDGAALLRLLDEWG